MSRRILAGTRHVKMQKLTFLVGGFARIRCPSCKNEHLLAFSCQSRNFCPSCQAKRSWLFAEKLREEFLAPVAHRHFTHSIPKALRGLEQEYAATSLPTRCRETVPPLLSARRFLLVDSLTQYFEQLADRFDVLARQLFARGECRPPFFSAALPGRSRTCESYMGECSTRGPADRTITPIEPCCSHRPHGQLRAGFRRAPVLATLRTAGLAREESQR